MITVKPKENEPRLKVRLTTSRYLSGNKYVSKREVYFYKQPNPEHLVYSFTDDVSMDGSIERIENLDSVKDGTYELTVTNISTDWETGWVDDWDWELIPWRD